MSKLDYVMDVAQQRVEMRASSEAEHTNHTDYSDDYCIGFD